MTLLGSGEGERLLAAGDLGELIRRTRRVTAINLTSVFEKGAFGEALVEGEPARRYFATLFDLLRVGPNERSVTTYFRAVEGLPQPRGRVATWPVVTLVPYLADPATHMFLKPTPTQEAEERLSFHLNYDPHPNWRTYKKLLELAALLLEDLRPLGARDFMDIQSFLFVASDAEYEDAEKPEHLRS